MKLSKLLTLPRMELAGVPVCAAAALLLRKLYDFCGGELVGIMFGSVNASPWEECKTLLLPYFLWAMLELLCLKPSLRRFTVSKTAGIYALAALFLGARAVLPASSAQPYNTLAALLCLAFCAIITGHLLKSRLCLSVLFAPSLSLLLLLAAFYFCFTPFPPDLPIFVDPNTQISGITSVMSTIFCV